MIVWLENYLNAIVNYDQSLSTESAEDPYIHLEYPYIQFYSKRHQETQFAASIDQNLNFILTYQNEQPARKQVIYVSLNSASTNLPNGLLVDEAGSNHKSVMKRTVSSSFVISSLKYRVVSNVLILSTQSNETSQLMVEFVLTNNFETRYDPRANSIQYRQLKTVKSDYSCVRLSERSRTWSARGAKLISFDPLSNVIKCRFELRNGLGVFAVVSPHGSFTGSNSAPIVFSIVFRVFVPLALAIILFTSLVLVIFKVHMELLRRFKICFLINSLFILAENPHHFVNNLRESMHHLVLIPLVFRVRRQLE